MSRSNRQVFQWNSQPVTAGGVLLYRRLGNQVELLMSFNRGRYEDLGGVADLDDFNIIDTASREVEEESNGMLRATDIQSRLDNASCFYTPSSKYLVYVLEATARESELTTDDFGPAELHDGFDRTISWIPLKRLKNLVKNWRLNNRALFDYLNSL